MTFQAARPLWTLSRMIARPELNLARNGLGELYEHCLQYAESLGIPDYLTCVPERHARAYDRAWQGAAPRRYNYQVELEERVLPGERPFYASHFRVMGHVAWPVPMLIRRHSLTGAERERVISLRGNLRKLLEEKYGAYADSLEQSSIEISGSFA